MRYPPFRFAATLFALAVFFAPPLYAQIPDDVLVVGQAAEPKSLDPHAATALNDFRILANLYEGLVRFGDGSLRVVPGLAKSWEIGGDGTVYTFRLHENVVFHDGSPFNAEAVKFNLDRMLDETHPYHDTGPFPLAFFFSAVQKTEAVDSHTVRLTLKKPYAPLLSNLAYPTGWMVSPAAVREHGKDFGRNPSGTGPFRFETWESNRRVVLVRNPDYRDGPPRLQAAVFRPIADGNTRVTEMLSGGIDLVVEVPPDAVPVFRKDDNLRVYEQVGPHLWFLILNCKEGPFADVRVRRAVNLAIDKKALVENVLQGTAEIAAGPVPPAFEWAYDETLKPYPHDPERARKLIREAGAAGAELTFLVAQGGSGMLEPVLMGTAIQADLAEVGLKATIESYEWNTYLDRVNPGLAGKAQMAQMAWMTNDPDTLPYLALRTEAWPDRGGFNSGYYGNPEVDRLLEAARTETDTEKRAELYRQMQRIVHEDAPWAFVAHWKQNAAAGARVKGFRLQPSFFLLLDDVYKE